MNNITIIPIKNLPEFSPKHDLADELIKGFENNKDKKVVKIVLIHNRH